MMSAIGRSAECGGLCARCPPSLPAPCFGDTAPAFGDEDQRIIWIWIQPATRTDFTHPLPQVTLWQEKIKSRCVVKGITKKKLHSCSGEHLPFASTASISPFNGTLIFLSGIHTYSSLNPCRWKGPRPQVKGGTWLANSLSIPLSSVIKDRDPQVSWEPLEDSISSPGGMLWGCAVWPTRVILSQKMRDYSCWTDYSEYLRMKSMPQKANQKYRGMPGPGTSPEPPDLTSVLPLDP